MRKPAHNRTRAADVNGLTRALSDMCGEVERVLALPGVGSEDLKNMASLMGQIRLLMQKLATCTTVPETFRDLTARCRDLEGKVKEMRNDARKKNTNSA